MRVLPRSRLENLIPSLVEGQALVALVPATGDLKWAAAAAWDVARAATRGGRRVALVDLWLEDPRLHEVVGLTPTDGIVDAFQFDVSLNKAAHEVDGVFFIAAGSSTTHPNDLFGHARWPKLHGGFRVEGAMLLLYLSAGGVARLSTVPDGLLVLSPDGYEPESSIGQGITAALERGVPLLGVVRERWTPGAPGHPPEPLPRAPAATAQARRRRVRPAVVAVTLVAGAAGSWALIALGGPHPGARPVAPPPRHAPAATPAAAPTLPASLAPASASATPPTPAPRADSLPWTIQLAAYAGLDKARALADRLATRDVAVFVTPVALSGGGGADAGSVWFRVLVGAFATRDAAAAKRTALWRSRATPRGQGELLRAPYSLSVTGVDRDSLRARGILAVPWGVGTAGRARALIGAFETPEQAAIAEAQLKRAGIPARLVTRVGSTP